jgi:dihydrofolate reductase
MSESKVLLHFTITLDGFVAGPDHEMDWMAGLTAQPGIVETSAAATGAIIAGRRGFDAAPPDVNAAEHPYGGRFTGPIFLLTHHPEDARPDPTVTFLNCDIADAVATAKAAANGKNVEIFSADIGQQAIERDLVDEIYLHLAPVILGTGIRLFANLGHSRWARIGDGDPLELPELRYRPLRGTAANDDVTLS